MEEGDDTVTVMEPVELCGYHPPEVTFSKTEPTKQSVEGDRRAGLEGSDFRPISVDGGAPDA